jgi:hypothetical protein
LAATVRTYPPLEKGLKGCRGLQVSVVASVEHFRAFQVPRAAGVEDLKVGNGALCGSRLPHTNCLA